MTLYKMFQDILEEVGLPVMLGKNMKWYDVVRATILIFVMDSRGRFFITYDL